MTNKLLTQSSALENIFKTRLQTKHNGSTFSSRIMLLSFQVNGATGRTTFILPVSHKSKPPAWQNFCPLQPEELMNRQKNTYSLVQMVTSNHRRCSLMVLRKASSSKMSVFNDLKRFVIKRFSHIELNVVPCQYVLRSILKLLSLKALHYI